MNPYYEHEGIRLFNCDCLPAMKEMPDNAFDLAIVDPPYGIGRFRRGGSLISVYGNPGAWNNVVPAGQYFKELLRVSRSQIIWGGNYFSLPLTGAWIFWDKGKNHGSHANFADGELAWTSFDFPMKKAAIRYDGFVGADKVRIHPTQKPVALYKWLLTNYAKPGQAILDTHLGSGSIAIACDVFGFDLTAYEIDGEYIEGATERLKRHRAQGVLPL